MTNITKQEVVSRQLETAIVLFFCDDDAISVHVLGSAASQILYDVCKHKGEISIRDVWQDYIGDEHQKNGGSELLRHIPISSTPRMILSPSLSASIPGRTNGCCSMHVLTI